MQDVGKKWMCCNIIIEGCEHVQIIIFDSFLVMRAICYLNYSKSQPSNIAKNSFTKNLLKILEHQFSTHQLATKSLLFFMAHWIITILDYTLYLYVNVVVQKYLTLRKTFSDNRIFKYWITENNQMMRSSFFISLFVLRTDTLLLSWNNLNHISELQWGFSNE